MKSEGKPQVPKNNVIACLLVCFLGAFGIHNFYLRNVKKAFFQFFIMLSGIMSFYVVFFYTFVYDKWNFFQVTMTEKILNGYIFIVLCSLILLAAAVWWISDSIRIFNGKMDDSVKLSARILAIFLGWLGIHNFYLMRAKGFIQLFMTLIAPFLMALGLGFGLSYGHGHNSWFLAMLAMIFFFGAFLLPLVVEIWALAEAYNNFQKRTMNEKEED